MNSTKDEIDIYCIQCGELIERGNLIYSEYKKRKFCNQSCAASYNNKITKKKEVNRCLNCNTKIKRGNKFCSNQCQQDYYYEQYIIKWKNGEISGTTGNAWLDLSKHIRRYIFEKYGNKCAKCGWAEINPFTGSLPLEIEHIDGDATNNKEENLLLLCPNCHSLTETYRGANKGHGTRDVKWISRIGTTNIDI